MLILMAQLLAARAPACDDPMTVAGGARPHQRDLLRLVQHVRASDPEAQVVFARIALYEMVLEHEVVLARIRKRPLEAGAHQRKLQRWVGATRRYLDGLKVALSLLDEGGRVELETGPAGVTVLLDAGPVIISSIDLRTPEVLDGRIADTYCQLVDCRFREDGRAAPPRVNWSFGDRGRVTLETNVGMAFSFVDLSARALKERVVAELAAELALLEAEVRATLPSDGGLEQRRLAVRAVAGREIELVASGWSLRLCLPRLARAQGVEAFIVPWLRDRLAGGRRQHRVADAEKLLSQLLVR